MKVSRRSFLGLTLGSFTTAVVGQRNIQLLKRKKCMGVHQQVLASQCVGTGLPFDNLSTTHLGVWDLQRQRTNYAGYAVRVALAADSGATTLDIGFVGNAFDMAAYSAFGTGSERVITWYDQSGNGFDLSRAWSATLCPIIRTSTYNNLPCVYFSTGSIGNAGFTDWNGLPDVNMLAVVKAVQLFTHGTWGGGSDLHQGYTQASSPQFFFLQGYGQYNTFAYANTDAGHISRWQYDGGAATDLLQARFSVNNDEKVGTNGAPINTTWFNETGLYINGNPAGAGAGDNEFWGVYYLGYELTPSEWTALYNGINAQKFNFTSSVIYFAGDSLTFCYGTNPSDIPHTWPVLVAEGLETTTGRTWDGTNEGENGADLARILALINSRIIIHSDTLKRNNVCTLWGGTNDVGTVVNHTAAQALTDLGPCLDAIYNAGMVCPGNGLVPVLNLIPANDGRNGVRDTFNAGLAATIAGKGFVVDVASIPELSDPTNLTYFLGDGVHLTTLGYSYIATAVLAAVEPHIN